MFPGLHLPRVGDGCGVKRSLLLAAKRTMARIGCTWLLASVSLAQIAMPSNMACRLLRDT